MSIFYQILLMVASAGFFIASNTIAARWAKTDNNLLWIPIFISAAIGYVLFGFVVKQKNLAVSSGLVDSLIVIISILIGIFILKEITTLPQTIGLIFASLAVILLLF